jgi:hypothetical protein
MQWTVPTVSLSDTSENLLKKAYALSRTHFGHALSLHIPGMFVVNGRRGCFRAVSVTGDHCDLGCEHCKGSLLQTMAHALTPDHLVQIGMEAADRGDRGMLVTGGCDHHGRLPWARFLPALERLTSETDLKITVHSGQVDAATARGLARAGIHQALIDVIGDDETARDVYHLPDGVSTVKASLKALLDAGLEIVPHILFGLHYGRELGERAALEMLDGLPVFRYAVVVLVPKKGTPMAGVTPPAPQRAGEFIAEARLALPGARASLGCARPRGKYSRVLEFLAVRAGINALALPSDAAIQEAERLGLSITYHETCCSLS